MAKKKKRNWIEERDEVISRATRLTNVKGSYEDRANDLAQFRHEREVANQTTSAKSSDGTTSSVTQDQDSLTRRNQDSYQRHIMSTLGRVFNGQKIPQYAFKDYASASRFLMSNGLDAKKVGLLDANSYRTKVEENTNKSISLQQINNQISEIPSLQDISVNIRKSYNSLDAVKDLANQRKTIESTISLANDYIKKYGKDKNVSTILEYATNAKKLIDDNAKGGSAVSNKVNEEREALFKPTIPGQAPLKDIQNKYAAYQEMNMQEKFGKEEWKGPKKEVTFDYDELLKAQTPAEKEFADAKRYELNPAKAYEDNKKIIKGLGDSKEDKERKTTLEETNNYYLYQKGVELQKKMGMDDNSMILLADGSRKGEYYMFGSDIPGYADSKKQDSEPTLSAPKKGSNTDNWLNRLKFTGNSYSFDDPRDYRGKGGVVTDEHGVFKVSSKDDMVALLQQKGLSKEEANIYLDYAKDYGSKRWEKLNYEAGKEAGEKNSALKNLAIDIGMSATSVPRAIIGQTGISDDFEKDLRAKEAGFEETKKKDMNGAESFLYDVGETVGSIALNSAIYGGMGSLGAGGSTAGKIAQQGATALPFATKAAQDSYYTALDKGAGETEAKLYGAASGLITELIYGVKIGNLGKIAKGEGSGIVSGLAKKILNGEVAPSVGKAALASIGKGALKGGAAFGRLTAEQRVADMLTQAAILGDKSDINLIYEKYLDQGLSEDEAWKKTATDVGVQFGQQILTESAKGAIMGAGGSGIDLARRTFTAEHHLPENVLLRSEEYGTELRDNNGKVVIDDEGQPIRVQQGLNIDSKGNVIDRNVGEELKVTLSDNGAPIYDKSGKPVTVNGQLVRAERTTLNDFQTYNKLRNEYEEARTGLDAITEKENRQWDDFKEQGFSTPEEVSELNTVKLKFEKDYQHVLNKAKTILGEYKPITGRTERDLLEGKKKLESYKQDLDSVEPKTPQEAQEIQEASYDIRTKIVETNKAVAEATGLDVSTNIKFKPDSEYTLEQLRVKDEYIYAVDPKLKSEYEKAINTKEYVAPYDLGKVTKEQANAVNKILGFDISGYNKEINRSAFEHIYKRHGIEGEANKSLSNANDVSRIKYVLDDFDRAYPSRNSKGDIKKTKAARGMDGEYGKKIIFEKKIDGTYVVVEGIAENKKKKIRVVSAYTIKEGSQVPNVDNDPKLYVRNEVAQPSYSNNVTSQKSSVNLDNLTDRQAEVAEKGISNDMSDDAVKVMVANDTQSVSPEEYANGFNMYYILGKDSNIKSFDDAVSKMDELGNGHVLDDISIQAAGVAFSKGKEAVPKSEVKAILKKKPSGTFKADFESSNMDEKYVHGVLENVAKLSGADVLIVENFGDYEELKNVPDNTQGLTISDEGKVILQRDVANILGTEIHEVVGHLGKQFAQDAYSNFVNIVEKVAREDLGIKGFDKQIKDLITEYRKAGQEISYEEAREEAIAYFAETMMLNPEVVEKFVKKTTEATISDAQKKNIIQTVLEWIKNAIKVLKDRMSKAKVREGTEGALREDLVESDEVVDAMIDVFEQGKKTLENTKATKSEKTTPVNKKYSFVETTPEEEQQHIDKLVEEYGTLEGALKQWSQAGFITTDGQVLDFGHNGQRGEDHRSVSSVYVDDDRFLSNSATENLTQFMVEGNIRVIPETTSLDFSSLTEPTNKQLDLVEEYIDDYAQNNQELTIEFSNERGQSIDSKTYSGNINADEVLNDIERFYRDGEIGGSEYSQFRYSLSGDEKELVSKNGIKKSMDKGSDLKGPERAKILGKVDITPVHVTKKQVDEVPNIDTKKDFKNYARNNMDVIGKSVYFEDLGINAVVSMGTIKESLSWQKSDLSNLVLAYNNIKQLAKDSKVIKIQDDRNTAFRNDVQNKTVKNFSVLVGLLKRSEEIIPVKIEVKENTSHNNSTKLIVTAEIIDSIEKAAPSPAERNSDSRRLVSTTSSDYKLTRLLPKIKDINLIKYFPDEMLSDEQLLIKKQALINDAKKDCDRGRMDEITRDKRIKQIEDNYSDNRSDVKKSVTQTNEDIRYSLKEELTDRDIDNDEKTSITQTNENKIEKYSQIHEDIGRQLKLVKGSKLDSKQTRSIALGLKKKLGSKMDTLEVSHQLNSLFTLIENKGGNINNTDVMDKAHQVVRDVMKEAKEPDPTYMEIVRGIRKTPIYLSEKDKAQIPDYPYFRKASFGKFRFVNDNKAVSVDEFFKELEENHPDVYSSIVDKGYPDASTLLDVSNWIDAVKDDAFSLYDMEGEQAVDYYVLDLLNDYSNTKVEDITNSKAKQRELYKNIGEMVDFAKEQQKTINEKEKEFVSKLNQQQSDISIRLDEQKRELQDSYNKTFTEELSKTKEKYNEREAKKIAKLKAQQKERLKKYSEDRKRTEKRQSIRKTRDRVKTTITKPTVKKYIPKTLQRPVAELFNSIDLGEQYSISRLNKMRDNAMIKYQGRELEDKLSQIDAQEYKFTNKLKEFKDSLERYVKDAEDDSDTYFAPVIKLIEDTIDKVGTKSLMKMTSDELNSVSKTLRAIEKSTTERNRPVTMKFKDENGKKIETYEEAAKLANNQLSKTDLGKLTKAITSHLTGRNTIMAMGGWNPNSIHTQIANQFDDAYIKESEIKQRLHAIIDPVISEKKGKTQFTTKAEDMQKYKKDDLVDVGYKDKEGNPILLNHDSLVFEYLNLASDDNLNHLARGGTTFPDYKKLYSRKSKKEIYGNGIRTGNVDAEITDIERQMNDAYEDEDYNVLRNLANNKATILEQRKKELKQIRKNIEKELTDYDKRLIKAWKEVRDISTEMLNEYWVKTYGYENFTESDYWHIETDPNFIKGGDGGNLQQVITNLSESGAVISRQEGAGNPIISGSALFQIDEYINDVAKRIAYSGLQRDLNAVFKYKLPGYDNVQSTLQHKMPKVADNFVTIQQSIFGGRANDKGKGDRAIATLRGLSARSVLSPNLRVALAQVPSFLGTYRYTDAKAVTNAWLSKNRVKQSVINKYTPLMYARGATGFSLETADLLQDTNKLVRGLNKADRLAHGWIFRIPNKMDTWTVRHTFSAYLDYARRNYPDLEEGTKEQIENGESPLYKKAAELFNEGTMRTQPMFNVFNRNAWQLSDNEFAKTLTVFHTQPFQYLNLITQDIMEYKYEKENGGKDVKPRKNKVLKSIASVLVANSLFVLMKLAVDKTVRHKDDEMEPDYIAEQLFSSYANMFILGSTAVDGLYNLIKNGRINDFEIYGTGTINALYDFAEATAGVIDGKSIDYKKNILEVLGGLGIPASNIEKDIGGVFKNIEDFIDNGEWDYSNEKDEKELLSLYILGDYSIKDLNKLGVKLNDDNKVRFSNAVETLYVEGEITKDEAFAKMKESNLFHPNNNYQSDDSFVEGKIERFDIKSYKDAYVSSLSGGKETAETRKTISEIEKLPYENAFASNPDSVGHKNYKTPHQKLINYIRKWK